MIDLLNKEITPTQFLLLSAASEASTREFVEVVCAYWVIFPESEQQLIQLAQDLLTRGEKAAGLEILSRGLKIVREAVGRYIVWYSIHMLSFEYVMIFSHINIEAYC
ncbi:hypothetical protein ACSBR1_026655 [Camellia fascicularis]